MVVPPTTNRRPCTEGTTRTCRPGRNLLPNLGTCVEFRIKIVPFLTTRRDVVPTFAIASIAREAVCYLDAKGADCATVGRSEQVQVSIRHTFLPQSNTTLRRDNDGSASMRRNGRTCGDTICRTGIHCHESTVIHQPSLRHLRQFHSMPRPMQNRQ